MKSLADLSEYYRLELRPILESFEVRRRKVFAWLALVGSITLVASGVLLAIGLPRGAPMIVLIALVPGGLAFGLVCYFMVGSYTRAFKATVLTRLVKFLDPGLRFS